MHEVRAPFTDTPLGHLPLCGEAEVTVAVGRACVAAEAWARVSPDRRTGPLQRFHDLVLERQDEILDIVQLETGKARAHAFEEVADVAIVTRYYLFRAPGLLAPRRRRGVVPGLTRVTEYRKPKGVVGIIAPWNYPLSLGATDAVPALLAGNAVVLKPDLQTTHTALWLSELLADAGLPEHLFQVLSGDGPTAGGALVDAADFISFTGSTATGRIVAARAGARLIGASLELGGKNAMIVRADADLERAVEGALRGAFASTGQLCMSIERLYVHRILFDAFVARFVERVSRLRLGSGLDWGADLGSLTSAAQLSKVTGHLEDAVSKGVTVRAGGRPRPEIGPFFFEPTVLTGVTPAMRLHAEETFGPVVAVGPFDSDDEAVELANDSRYGLNASVWSRDTRAARALARRIEAGTVNVNEAYSAAWASVDAPMGGVKDSGLGRRHGVDGLLKYTEAQTIAVQHGVSLDLSAPWVGRPAARRVATGLLGAMRRIPGLR
jgi:succinate-semialdehyde dehydrogenase/glutarate-semialdehyde dehydrogenase